MEQFKQILESSNFREAKSFNLASNSNDESQIAVVSPRSDYFSSENDSDSDCLYMDIEIEESADRDQDSATFHSSDTFETRKSDTPSNLFDDSQCTSNSGIINLNGSLCELKSSALHSSLTDKSQSQVVTSISSSLSIASTIEFFSGKISPYIDTLFIDSEPKRPIQQILHPFTAREAEKSDSLSNITDDWQWNFCSDLSNTCEANKSEQDSKPTDDFNEDHNNDESFGYNPKLYVTFDDEAYANLAKLSAKLVSLKGSNNSWNNYQSEVDLSMGHSNRFAYAANMIGNEISGNKRRRLDEEGNFKVIITHPINFFLFPPLPEISPKIESIVNYNEHETNKRFSKFVAHDTNRCSENIHSGFNPEHNVLLGSEKGKNKRPWNGD